MMAAATAVATAAATAAAVKEKPWNISLIKTYKGPLSRKVALSFEGQLNKRKQIHLLNLRLKILIRANDIKDTNHCIIHIIRRLNIPLNTAL